MLIKEALLAYARFLAVFGLTAVIGAKLVFRKTMPVAMFRRLRVIDRWYGISAVLVIITGLARLNLGIEGTAFFTHNPIFWAKMSLLAFVGILSITPTVLFIRRKPRKTAGDSLSLSADEHSRANLALAASCALPLHPALRHAHGARRLNRAGGCISTIDRLWRFHPKAMF